MAKIVLAMSGGVDSSVAAALLLSQGHEVTGVFMKHDSVWENFSLRNGEKNPVQNSCSSVQDELDARYVAEKLKIPLHVVSFRDEFLKIIDYFAEEYIHGRTPNPCAKCNAKIKFGKIFDFADSVGGDFVATGHYARILPVSSHEGNGASQSAIYMGVDLSKDQSYVLFGIRRELLSRLMFPVGHFQKTEIRRMAENFGFSLAQKRDSQEICFVPDKNHARFVREYFAVKAQSEKRGKEADDEKVEEEGIKRSVSKEKIVGCAGNPGEFITVEGTVVGMHSGLEKYTIGQRKGLGLAFGEPRYVIRLEYETNRVVIGTYEQLAQHSLDADGVNWLIPVPKEPFSCMVKVRYRTAAVMATVIPGENQTFHVKFNSPIYGVAPGQAVVCYDGQRLLGGGWIK
ncbi:MAG: tRNA 2-thiouridine(34) synthase MnmA [Planctomycetia bacterium]|nr:tRNA 2-thiouridine(34) synthase MnmA [Planctomycetia bacterium]